jgi:tetratricopeptide (TPR) repeat protein
MQADNCRGARRVYAWSFYSQGTGERVTSADQFINHALNWFGDPKPTSGSPWDKGERLAKLIQSERTLLVLDGLEPLQSGQAFEKGKIKEPALVTLLTELARQNEGLCLITTREWLTDLDDFIETVIQKDLEQISDEAGRALLRVGGIQGTDAELEQTTRAFGNHALALNLLAVYLHELAGCHVSHAAEIPELEISEKEGKHPRRVMAALASRFGNGPEVELLKMLGLFDRPADTGSLRALRKAPIIKGLSDHIRKLTDARWLYNIERLRNYKLIAPRSQHRLDDLDAHPLVREHFSEQLKRENLEAWKAGNGRLYDYLTRSTKVLPENLEPMMPLYVAVAHGCAAGKHEEALNDVYYKRILRKTAFYSKAILGAYSSDLAALSNFYSLPWQPVGKISIRWKGWLLNDTGWTLYGLGRLGEAVQLLEAAVEIAVGAEEWHNLTVASISLTDIKLAMGDIDGALLWATRAEEGATDASRKKAARLARANVLFQAGQTPQSELTYKEADEMMISKVEESSASYVIYSLATSHFCELLLDQGNYDQVLINAQRMIQWASERRISLEAGLGYLSLARAQVMLAQELGADFNEAARSFETALDKLREAAVLENISQAFIARAGFHRVSGDYNRGHIDLEQGMRIATRGSMRLVQADCHLEYARLYVMQGEKKKGNEHWRTAREMIEHIGYHRRDKDVEEIEAQLAKI